MLVKLRRFIVLLPWWFGTLGKAMAAVLAMGWIWTRYVAYIPPDRRKAFRLYVISRIEGSLRSATAMIEPMDSRTSPYSFRQSEN
jgi:hypothetical protein